MAREFDTQLRFGVKDSAPPGIRRLSEVFRRLCQARETLGLRGERHLQREIQRTQAAYQCLVRSGTLSASEQQVRAYDRMQTSIARLRQEMTGAKRQQRSWLKGTLSLGSGLVTGVMTLRQRANFAYRNDNASVREAGLTVIDQHIRAATRAGGGIPRPGGLLDHVTAGLSDALATIRRGNEGIACISNLVASAEYVVQALADEVQTLLGSVMNYLDMPSAFVSDLKGLLSTFSDRLNFNEVTRLSDWLAGAQSKRTAGFAERRVTASAAGGQGGVFASTLNRASIMPQADRELINQTVRLVTIAEWVDVAADIFQAEEETPTLSGSDIERLCEEVRALIVTAIVTQRTVMDTRPRTAHQAHDVATRRP
ncbi:MAG: hypothetical protein ACR5LG_14505 [Sodalis sp. (in: enterobacteria)]|uniref:hypothetical protein n=1 Tax=Sodalis sp. (in: enterobacteria) TaxID=1898979 RepID=UPI003F3194B9